MLQMKHNMVRIPNGGKQSSCLFTSAAEISCTVQPTTSARYLAAAKIVARQGLNGFSLPRNDMAVANCTTVRATHLICKAVSRQVATINNALNGKQNFKKRHTMLYSKRISLMKRGKTRFSFSYSLINTGS